MELAKWHQEQLYAFFFTTTKHSKRPDGLADAWQAEHADSTQGLAVAASQVMAMGASPPVAVSKPSALPKSWQMADRIVKGASLPASAYETSSSAHAVGENQLMAVMLGLKGISPRNSRS